MNKPEHKSNFLYDTALAYIEQKSHVNSKGIKVIDKIKLLHITDNAISFEDTIEKLWKK
jgi:hypothetical protein